MSVLATIQSDLITALKHKATVEVSALRSLKAAIQKDIIDHKSSADDDQRAFALLKQEAKKREDSIAAYSAANRSDLADIEMAELAIIKKYLPEQLSEAAIQQLVDQVVQASADKNFGLVMKQVMQHSGGRADGKIVSTLVKKALAV